MPRNRRRPPGAVVHVADHVLERHWQATLLEAADDLGWIPYHIPDSRRATAAGFPDLVLRHDVIAPFIVIFELKTSKGGVGAEQPPWLTAFQKAGVEAHLVRLPADWEKAISLLSGGKYE